MKTLLTIILTLFSLNTFCQNLITISTSPKVVPDGKKWILPTNKEILIEVSGGSLNSGTRCNADLLSNPRIISTIIEGEYGNPNSVYGILFKELEKVNYTNDYTFSIIPVSIVDQNFSLSSLAHESIKNVGKKQIVFMPGQRVYVSECLRSIQLVESNLNQSESAEINKKKKEQEAKEKSLEYKSVGNRLFNVTWSSLNGIDDWNDHGITGIKKILIRDKQEKFIIINEKGVVNTYDIRDIKNLENGKQEIGIGWLDQATITSNSDKTNIYILASKRQEMGHIYSNNDATMQIISDKEADNILNEIEVQKQKSDSIKENTYPKYASSKKIFEAFFIKKKSNGELKAQWINEDKRIVNFSAVYGVRLKDFNELQLYPELKKEIEKQMQDKSSGMYYLSLDVTERLQEVSKGVLQKDREQISVHEFYKGDYDRPQEIYKQAK